MTSSEPTRLTQLLRLALPAYYIIGTATGFVPPLLRTIDSRLSSGGLSAALPAIAIFSGWIVLMGVLGYGSLKLWRWAFWGYLVLFGFMVVSFFQDGVLRTTFELFSDPIGVVLLVAATFGLVRFGPWAMKKSSATATSAT